MRIAILGGTRFIGRAVLERLAGEGHELLVVHRGEHEPAGLVAVEHAHVDRHDGTALAAALKPFDPEALVDISGMNAAAADAALGAVSSSVKLVAISSCDVYRAYDGLHSERTTDAVPLTEESPLRSRPCARRSGGTSRTRRPMRPATSPRMTPYWGENWSEALSGTRYAFRDGLRGPARCARLDFTSGRRTV